MTKIDIFSGFLGAGKTTLIKKLIREAYAGQKLVLIENEFGEIGIDGGFLQDSGIEINEMNSGCICCSLVGDFGRALEEVLTRFTPDRILIEPSGVGKLSDIIRAVQDLHNDKVSLNSFTTVVDAAKGKMYMKNFGEFFNNQIEHAGCVVLSRTDGMNEAKLDACVEMIRSLNPSATVITTPWDQLDGKQILAAMEKTDTLQSALELLRKEHEEEEDECECDEHEHHHHHHDEDEHEHHHDHEDECECGHDHHGHHHHHADEVFTSWGVETPKKYTAEQIQQILQDLEDDRKYGMILRAKGIVAGAEGQWIHFDYTPGEVNVRYGSAQVTGRLCVIGSQLKEDAIAALFGL